MNNLTHEAKQSFYKHSDPDTSSYECFFHYTDEGLFVAGFTEGFEYAKRMLGYDK